MVDNSQKSVVSNVHFRQANMGDFQELNKLLVKFYTSYEYMCVHLKIQEVDVVNLVLRRLLQILNEGVCTVAVINGKIEGVFAGVFMKRNEKDEPDYIYLSEKVQVVEGICYKLKENLWNQLPLNTEKVCLVRYGVVTAKAQKAGVAKVLFDEFAKQCKRMGGQALVSSSLTERTAQFAHTLGFAVVNSLPLSHFKNQNGRGYFEGRSDKMASLQIAFLDNASKIPPSKL